MPHDPQESPEFTIPEAYHRWYYDARIWERVHWLGVPCLKSVSDMWNYQEIIAELRPGLIIEFGTRFGGAALFFASICREMELACRVITVDTDHTDLDARLREDPSIEIHLGRSTDSAILRRVEDLRSRTAAPAFAILDSDHRKQNVLAEMQALRPILQTGDYLVVEDSNINGHPVLPDWGDGPWEAIQEYRQHYPDDYEQDASREQRFGFTFAPRGFLRRL
jgi:cephalosporin hydroxylase